MRIHCKSAIAGVERWPAGAGHRALGTPTAQRSLLTSCLLSRASCSGAARIGRAPVPRRRACRPAASPSQRRGDAPALLRQAHRRAREAPPTRGRVSPRRRQRSLGKHVLQSADALHRVHLGRSRARGYYRYTWQARGGLLRPPPRVSVNLVPLRSDETTRTSADSLVPRPAASGPDHRRHNVRWNCLPSRIGVCRHVLRRATAAAMPSRCRGQQRQRTPAGAHRRVPALATSRAAAAPRL